MFNALKVFLVLVFSFIFAAYVIAGKIERGFESLAMYDYFKAKNLFEASLNKRTTSAAFGLSKIFLNDKNPFHNLDSAYHYIIKSQDSFHNDKSREKKKLAKLSIDSFTILALKDQVCLTAFEKAVQENSIVALQHYVDYYKQSDELFAAIKRRNSLAFRFAHQIGSYQAYAEFLALYPDAEEAAEVKVLYDKVLFISLTKDKTLKCYTDFIVKIIYST